MTSIAYAKRALLKALRKRGITIVTIEYDGEGDNGQIGDILAFDAEKRAESPDEPCRLALYRGKAPSDYASLQRSARRLRVAAARALPRRLREQRRRATAPSASTWRSARCSSITTTA